jgi:hypothetical protein
MTETEWLACTYPQEMLAIFYGRASDRKLRLFALACIRPHRSLLSPDTLDALAIAEKFSDGIATPDERKSARRRLLHTGGRPSISTADRRGLVKASVRASLARRSCVAAIRVAGLTRQIGFLSTGVLQADALEKTECGWKTVDWTSGVRDQLLLQVNILHDLFDDLFRPMRFDPKWRTREVFGQARAVYDKHAFDRLPALADALAGAECDDGELLAHCRNGGVHYRGCWVLDAILGLC